jgi:hypothetical protein
MNPLIKRLMLALLGIAVLALGSAHGQIVVNSTGDAHRFPHKFPSCDTDPLTPGSQCTLRAAIETANVSPDNSTIRFKIPTTDPGYNPQTGSYTISLQSALPDVSTDMSISGPDAEKLTVTRNRAIGTPDLRIFNVTTSGVATFSGLIIADGALHESGAGIQNVNNGTVNITNCTLSNNYSDSNGGAIFNAQSGTVNVTNCTLSNNYSNFNAGGAIFNAQSGTVNVTNCTLKFNNGDGGGGGIANLAGFINVSNSEFIGNTAGIYYPAGGGGIASNGVVSISGSTFYQNISRAGGAVFNGPGTLTVTNSTFYANMVWNFGTGGGIFNYGTLNLSNCTVTANFSDYQGSGVYNVNGKIANVKSTIVALNYGGVFLNYSTLQIGEAPDVFGSFNSRGFNLIGKKDGSTGFTATTDKNGTLAAPLDPKLDPKGLRNNGGPTRTLALQRSCSTTRNSRLLTMGGSVRGRRSS